MSETTKQTNGPLSGLTVVDVGMLFAGPLVGTLLADLGATVIKVEHPKGDEVRRVGRFRDGEPLWWRVTARNKQLAAVDIRTEAGREVLLRLIDKADILVENFRPGRMAEWGFHYEELAKMNPGLIMLHISGYGQTGPYRERPGMGTLAEAFSGFAHTMGPKDAPPSLPMFPIADGVAAITGAYAVLAALYARSRDGRGDEIDLSLYEPMLSLMGAMVIDYDQLKYIASRHGNRSNWSVPRNSYLTKDNRWVAVSSAANSVAKRLFRAIGRADLADDPGLATNPQRVKRIEECDGAIADWVAQRTQEEVLAVFREAEVVAGPICDVEQIFADPHVHERGTLAKMQDPVLGEVRIQDVVPKFSRNRAQMRWLGRTNVGEDTATVLSQLGYSDEEIEALASSGAVHVSVEAAVSGGTV
ncbi:crotonobetainyl-CoA:carnitine CoA-transferase CaiB-like acyl-CoA transferase [Paraburkholderia silvatlantica]|uniref:Crotonobetainyl-CoA:carnitine CoA-transferase CaiB-like acyl-CoA transferase n=1 Tax=Paraburkholderia silvatlantica TaxID=321895 RepID=A0A2V4TJ14_9BURK|nr:CoA transferase [Paraburkholderia silvatlantica]PYE25479.1 crotonobetainyl-CoA:carnitine CoA-transferase CaiB-like acyl-CoA transferase [Paraburkholderia silvatlantica]